MFSKKTQVPSSEAITALQIIGGDPLIRARSVVQVHPGPPFKSPVTAALTDAQTKAILIIFRSLQAQASVLSYIDILQSLSVICACMIPLVLLMKRPPKGTQAAVH